MGMPHVTVEIERGMGQAHESFRAAVLAADSEGFTLEVPGEWSLRVKPCRFHVVTGRQLDGTWGIVARDLAWLRASVGYEP